MVAIDEVVIAYLLGQPDYDGLLDILRLGVAPQFQRQGIGSRLLERALRDYPAAMLCVRMHNLDAFRLYYRWGFRVVGQIRSESAWVLRTTSNGGR